MLDSFHTPYVCGGRWVWWETTEHLGGDRRDSDRVRVEESTKDLPQDT